MPSVLICLKCCHLAKGEVIWKHQGKNSEHIGGYLLDVILAVIILPKAGDEGTSHKYTSAVTEVKVICKGQGEISRSLS